MGRASTCFDRSLASLICRNLGRQLRPWSGIAETPSDWLICLKQLLYFLPLAALGGRLLRFKARLFVWLARARLYFWWGRQEKMYRAFLDYYTRATALWRVEFALLNSRSKCSQGGGRRRYLIEQLNWTFDNVNPSQQTSS